MRPSLAVAAAVFVGIVVGVYLSPRTPDQFPFEQTGDFKTAPVTASFRAGRVAADSIWGEACGGRVTILAVRLGDGELGRAGYDYPPGFALDPDRYGTCSIRVDSDRTLSPRQVCAVVVHEWGHLTGHNHSRDRDRIMFPKLSSRNVPKACE